MISCINHVEYECTLFDNKDNKALKIWPKSEREKFYKISKGLLDVDGP
jgi:hypothetical protein